MTGFEPATAASLEQSGTIYTSAGFDVIALLPAASAERLRQLRQMSRDAHSLMPMAADRQEANTARGDAERRLQRMLAPRAENGFSMRETDKEVVLARQEIEKLTDEARRLEELYQARSEQWQSASQPKWAVEGWLKDGRPRGTVLQDYDGPEPKLVKGESITDAIERLRRRGRELKADLHRIQSAPFPSSHCKQRMRQQVEGLATVGTPSVSSLVEFGRDIAWPQTRVTSLVHNAQPGAVAFAEVPDALALFAWTFKDQLIGRLDAEIDAEADDAAALTHEARQQQEAEVMGDLLACERDESWLVWAALDERLPVEHRRDINPLAILGCRLVTAPAVNPSPGSSPGMSWRR